jgi:hypothetical protein
LAERALGLAQQHKERGHEACALKVLGDIALDERKRDAERAEVYYRQALALCSDLGMRPLAAHCRMGIGSAHASRGSLTEAKAEIGAALDQFHDMGMTLWRDRAQAVFSAMAE